MVIRQNNFAKRLKRRRIKSQDSDSVKTDDELADYLDDSTK